MRYASYSLRPVIGFWWIWEVERDGSPPRRGHAFGKRAARWLACGFIQKTCPPLVPIGEEMFVERRKVNRPVAVERRRPAT